MVSQKDIAAKLNISRSLVSKVLSGNLGTTKVNPQTQRDIIALAKKLGYKPNPVARSLVTGRQNTIGVAIRRFGNPASRLPDILTDGLTEEARLNNQKLLLTYYVDDTETRCLEFLTENDGIDGLILGGTIPDNLIEKLPEFNAFPVVGVCCQGLSSITRIKIDNPQIGRIATDHLISRGCRKIGLINSWDLRSRGFYQAHEAARMQINQELVYNVEDFTHNSGEDAAKYFIDSNIDIDGLVAQSDEQAAGAMNVLLKRGINVPGQVKVIGLDNSPFCEFCICPLSSVDPNLFDAGRMAMRMLLKAISDNDYCPSEISINPTLVQRESTQ